MLYNNNYNIKIKTRKLKYIREEKSFFLKTV